MILLGTLLERALTITPPTASSSSHATARDVNVHEPQSLVNLLTILSLIFASISVISTLSTLYWFLKMRRSFRHELIMLLIQSDFVKSAAFVIFPIVNLIHGNVQSNSAFCQMSGFALAVGVESADIAVLLIAVHSIMYIFRPRSGLYPYRRTAYMIYYLFPLGIASLAFVDGTGYQNVGHYCYLRTDNGWARMALSWVPRYIIGVSIVLIYAFVYFYVRKRMGDYGRRSSTTLSQPPSRAYRDSDVPPTPPIAYHGLLSSAPGSRRGSTADSIIKNQKRSSLSSVSTVRFETSHVLGSNTTTTAEQGDKPTSRQARPGHWNSNWSGFDKHPASSSSAVLLEDDQQDPLSPSRVSISSPPPVHAPETRHHRQSISEDPFDVSPLPNIPPYFRRPLAASYPTARRSSLSSSTGDQPAAAERRQRNVSFPNFVPIGRKGSATSTPSGLQNRISITSTDHTTTTTTTTTSTSFSNSNNQPTIALPTPPLLPPPTESYPILIPGETFEDGSGITKNREKIRRQLRSLIVYPLAYMIIWVFPFVSHIMGYEDSVNPADPKWLLVVSIISLCVQGTVDSLLFAVREKPWRYARGHFWSAVGMRLASSVNFWTRDAGWGWRWRGDGVKGGMAGRTREEMLVDGRLARQRREEEIASERAKAGGGEPASRSKRWSQSRPTREWWDVEGDGAPTDDERKDDDVVNAGEYDGDEDTMGGSVGGREEVNQHIG